MYIEYAFFKKKLIPQYSFTVNNSPTQDYVHPDDHTKPTYNTLYCPSKLFSIALVTHNHPKRN